MQRKRQRVDNARYYYHWNHDCNFGGIGRQCALIYYEK